MRFRLGLIAALALALAGAFLWAGPSAAQEERDDPGLAAKANEYVKQKFYIGDFFTESNDGGQPRRVHDLVFFPGVSWPMILWGPWHGDWKTDRFGLDRQRYVGYDRSDESVTNPMFPPDRDAGGVPLESRNWIPEPWNDFDVRAQHPEKVKDFRLDNPDLSDPEIISRLRDGLVLTAGMNGYAFTAETTSSDLYQNPQKYIHLYIPPTPNVWGMGVMFHRMGSTIWYVSVPLGPPLPDLGVRLEPPERQAKPGDELSFTLTASFTRIWNPLIGGRVYLAHKVGGNSYPVPFSLNGQQSRTDEAQGAAYVDVLPGGDREFQIQVTVHAQEIGSTLVAWIVPGGSIGGEFRLIDWYDSDPSNNRAEAKIAVERPNLCVRNLTLNPNPSSPGDPVQARAEIVNEGPQDVTTVARWIFEGRVVAEQEVSIPASGYNITQAQIQAPQEPGQYAVGVLVNPNRDRPANESSWDDNYAEGYLAVVGLEPPPATSGPDELTLQAWSHPGTDLYGNWQPARERPVNTAKWSDDVKATLKVAPASFYDLVEEIFGPGMIDWAIFHDFKVVRWEVSSARLTYPRQHPDFTFGCPYPPSGTVTVDMKPAGEEKGRKVLTAEFVEDWAMDGFPVYCLLEERQMTTEQPKAYPVTAEYTIKYEYTYYSCDKDGGCELKKGTHRENRSIRQDLLVTGAGTILYGS